MKYWLISGNEVSTNPNDPFENIIKKIHWRRRFIDGNDQVDTFNVLELPDFDQENFVPYENMTFEKYCEWLEYFLDVNTIDEGLENDMNKFKNPPTKNQELPFNNIEMDKYYQNLANPMYGSSGTSGY